METTSGAPGPQGTRRVTFADMYEATFPRVYGYFYRRTGGEGQVAEDLAHETYAAALTEIRGGGGPASEPWLFGIARHKLVDHYRRREREERKLALVWSAEPAEGEDYPSLTRDEVLQRLRDLPAAQQAALVLHHLDELPVSAVAEQLGRSVHATESLLVRARAAFRRGYEETGNG